MLYLITRIFCENTSGFPGDRVDGGVFQAGNLTQLQKSVEDLWNCVRIAEQTLLWGWGVQATAQLLDVVNGVVDGYENWQ